MLGGDEKWVKVPKNNKPVGKHRHWMYVYMAVDVWTYDLLHSTIFPHVGKYSARAFLSLVNAIERPRIPLTNNAAELVNRRFDQHDQNFCGFQSIETAEKYLAVFERIYRLTPFTQDAQKRVRGKCPLALAGYDVAKIPLVAYFQDHPPRFWGRFCGQGGCPNYVTLPTWYNTIFV